MKSVASLGNSNFFSFVVMLPFLLHDLNLEHLNAVGSEYSHLVQRLISMEQEIMQTNSNMVSEPFFHKHVALRVTVGITCCLSMFGAILIIASYFVMPDVQTKSRQILVHLSFADFGVSCSNFIGVAVYFDQYIRHCPHDEYATTDGTVLHSGVKSVLSCNTLRGLCKAQAFFAAYSTLASVMWTLSLAIYIYCLVVHSSKRVHYKIVYVANVVCWGLPMLIVIWLISTGIVSLHALLQTACG